MEWLSEYIISITAVWLLVLASGVFCNIKGSWAEYHRFYNAWYQRWSINNLTSGRCWWSNAWYKNLTLNKTGDYSGHDQVIGRLNQNEHSYQEVLKLRCRKLRYLQWKVIPMFIQCVEGLRLVIFARSLKISLTTTGRKCDNLDDTVGCHNDNQWP